VIADGREARQTFTLRGRGWRSAALHRLAQRASVSSVKNVWSITAPNARRPARRFGPKDRPSGITEVEIRRAAAPEFPRGPLWPITVSLRQRRHEAGEVLHLRGRDLRMPNAKSGLMPRLMLSMKRCRSACALLS
jgi:hypothetical protein